MFIVSSFIIALCLHEYSQTSDATDFISHDISAELLRIISKDNSRSKLMTQHSKHGIPLITIPTSKSSDFFDFFNRLTEESVENKRRSIGNGMKRSKYGKDRNITSVSFENVKYDNVERCIGKCLQEINTFEPFDATITVNIQKHPLTHKDVYNFRKQNEKGISIHRRNYREQSAENLETDISNEDQKSDDDYLENNSDASGFLADENTTFDEVTQPSIVSYERSFTKPIVLRRTRMTHLYKPQIMTSRRKFHTLTNGVESSQYPKDRDKVFIRMKFDKNYDDGNDIDNTIEYAEFEKRKSSIGKHMEYSNYENDENGIGNNIKHAYYEHINYDDDEENEKVIHKSNDKRDPQNEYVLKENIYSGRHSQRRYVPRYYEKVVTKPSEKLKPEDEDVIVNKYSGRRFQSSHKPVNFKELEPRDVDIDVNKYNDRPFRKSVKPGNFEFSEKSKPQEVSINRNKCSCKDLRRNDIRSNKETNIVESFGKPKPQELHVDEHKCTCTDIPGNLARNIDKSIEKPKIQNKDININKYSSRGLRRSYNMPATYENVVDESFENPKPQDIDVKINKYSDKDFRKRYVPGNFDSLAYNLDDMAGNLEDLAEKSNRPVNIRM